MLSSCCHLINRLIVSSFEMSSMLWLEQRIVQNLAVARKTVSLVFFSHPVRTSFTEHLFVKSSYCFFLNYSVSVAAKVSSAVSSFPLRVLNVTAETAVRSQRRRGTHAVLVATRNAWPWEWTHWISGSVPGTSHQFSYQKLRLDKQLLLPRLYCRSILE